MTEPAVEQKNIADFFWMHGDLSGEMGFQIAEGDLVATRWASSWHSSLRDVQSYCDDVCEG